MNDKIMPGKEELDEKMLERVSGGYYLSSDEVKSLTAGDKLTLEGYYGENLAAVTYLGQTYDPGTFSMLQCLVRIDELLMNDPLSGGESLEFLGGPTRDGRIRVGDEIFVSRYFLDFPGRA